MKIRRVYKVFKADRNATVFVGPRSGLKKLVPDVHGKIRLGSGLYDVDPNKVTMEIRKFWLGTRQQPVFIQYYREGNPVPMDPMDFSKEAEVDAFERRKFAEASFISALFRKEWDMTQMLLILSILGNMVLGGVIYTILR